MALANYSDLLTAIAAWASRSDLTERIPEFVALAEARMSADLTTKALEITQTATITSGVAPLPENVITILGLRIVAATKPDVEVTSRERIESLRLAMYTGSTTYAALIGSDVHVYPVTTGALEVRAKCRIPALSAGSTNWLMTNYPNAYLFGSLIEAANYAHDDKGMQRWMIRYAEAIRQANDSLVYRGQGARAVVQGATP